MGTIIDVSCNSILDLHADAWAAEDVPFRSITAPRQSASRQTRSIDTANESRRSRGRWVSNSNMKRSATRMSTQIHLVEVQKGQSMRCLRPIFRYATCERLTPKNDALSVRCRMQSGRAPSPATQHHRRSSTADVHWGTLSRRSRHFVLNHRLKSISRSHQRVAPPLTTHKHTTPSSQQSVTG